MSYRITFLAMVTCSLCSASNNPFFDDDLKEFKTKSFAVAPSSLAVNALWQGECATPNNGGFGHVDQSGFKPSNFFSYTIKPSSEVDAVIRGFQCGNSSGRLDAGEDAMGVCVKEGQNQDLSRDSARSILQKIRAEDKVGDRLNEIRHLIPGLKFSQPGELIRGLSVAGSEFVRGVALDSSNRWAMYIARFQFHPVEDGEYDVSEICAYRMRYNFGAIN